MREQHIGGVTIRAAHFTPASAPYAQQLCHGVALSNVDGALMHAPLLGVALLSALQKLYPLQFEMDRTLDMIGSRDTLQALYDGRPIDEIAQRWAAESAAFTAQRAAYLLY